MSPRIFLVGRTKRTTAASSSAPTLAAVSRRGRAAGVPRRRGSAAPAAEVPKDAGRTAIGRPTRRNGQKAPSPAAGPARGLVPIGWVSTRRVAGAGDFAEQERDWYRENRERSLASIRFAPPEPIARTPVAPRRGTAARIPAMSGATATAASDSLARATVVVPAQRSPAPTRNPAPSSLPHQRVGGSEPGPSPRVRHGDDRRLDAAAATRPPTSGRPSSGTVHKHRTSESASRGSRPANTEPKKKRLRLGRVIGWTLLTACVLVIAGAAWVGWRTYEAYVHLQAASAGVTTLQEQLTDITAVDPALTADTVSTLQLEAADAHAAVDDPVYRAASVVPFLGPNLKAIEQVTTTVDGLARDVMPSLVDVATTLEPATLAPKNGVIDLAPLQELAPLLQSADESVNDATARLAGIDRSELMRPLAEAVDTLSGKLQNAADVTEPAARAARLMPAMLGTDRPRTYLVVFQNPSELRATGGIFGSYAVLTANKGKLSLREQGAASRNLGYFDPPVGELTPAENALYSDLMLRYPQDVNFTPDFPRAAALFAEMYKQRSGTAVDGVLSIDPVALSYTLEGSPGFDVGNGVTLRSDNVVDTLLSKAYAQFDGSGQSERDAFLNTATSAVFSRVMAGQAEPAAIVEGLQRAAAERRVLIYSTDPTEEADISRTSLAGSLDADPDKPSIGVFFNDGTGAKLGYYLRNEVHLAQGRCRPGGRSEIQVRVTMTFDAPPAEAPNYVTGQTEPGQPYVLRTNVLTFAPVGGSVTAAQRDGKVIGFKSGQDHGRQVGTTTIEMAPGTSTEVVYTILGAAGAADGTPAVPSLVLTPGVNPWRTSVDRFRPCAADAG